MEKRNGFGNGNANVFSQGLMTTKTNNQGRSYLDALYKEIFIENVYWEFIDCPEFRRLREIKQLGVSHYIFPSAMHTRYEHCIGTWSVAKNLLDNLQKMSMGDIEFEENDLRNIMVAALCHDIGHGPFSHTFDNHFIQPLFPDLNWSHEQQGVELIEYIIDNNHIDDFTKNDVRMIQDLIIGKSTPDPSYSGFDHQISKSYDEEGWMFDIVNNKRNSIDVDKLDYIDRDTIRLGLHNYTYDNTKLLNGARIIDDQICYSKDSALSIHDLFITRYKLFRDIYTHKCTQGIELMICDILKQSNDYFKFHEIVQDMEE